MDQKLAQQIKRLINRAEVVSTDQRLNKKQMLIQSQIKSSKVRSTEQKFDQKIKSWINTSKVGQTDQKLD